MFYQLYYLAYTGEDDLKYISKVINEYKKIYNGKIKTNELVEGCIEHICFARITSRENGILQKYVLIFGINDDGESWKKFFESKRLIFDIYESEEVDKFLESKDKWYYFEEEYFSEDFVNGMYEKGFVNWFTYKQRVNVLNYIKKDKTYWNNIIMEFEDKELSEIYREIKKNKKEVKSSKIK